MKNFLIIILLSLFLINFGNQSFAQSDDKLVILHTNLGNIVIELFPNDAPNHVQNFIKLAEDGFYDGIIFHRIIPGFMIQGGDPNTKGGDQSTWGTGGPGYSVNAEFNTIKHNRGIVSMARAQDPNSAGSQFFIVHKDSNHLDQQYTIFGRIVTEESFATLDKIASVKTSGTLPVDVELVKITKAEVVNRSDVSNLLKLSEPERVTTTITSSSGFQRYEDKALDIEFDAPEGWILQQPEKTNENSPDVVAIGPTIGPITPYISLTISDARGKNLDEIMQEKNISIKNIIDSGINLEIISQNKLTINEKQAYVIDAIQSFENNGTSFSAQFREITISTPQKFYIFTYANVAENFNDHVSKFEKSINSFKIISEPIKEIKSASASVETDEKGGGCLIATAAYGSELAPQIQQLREIRDNTILSTQSGTTFMTGFNQFYYSFSPIVADLERENPVFKEAVKLAITPMLSTLSIMTLAEDGSEIEVLGLGLSVLALNFGMYFVIPTIAIIKIKNKF
ncbi:peptidylprolyl isomerase [Nitrosarchaeum sp.]|uniref:peptidylprolyl isomerase n=1 Tax=Nitrosarchaeum sp. TaxID=2026886 RepID=UPI00247DFF87|nr:peptidylprolyl isomerase [Nitrosarchaeum sp.]MCV0412578.1 peptidylprolyl isomerase [Nitrosarchaeum sp.]